MSKLKNTIVFAPSILSIFKLRILTRGAIYYTDPSDRVNQKIFSKIKKYLQLMKVIPFSYQKGMGSYGNGAINSVLKTASDLTDDFYDFKFDNKLIREFDKLFKSKRFSLSWKKSVYPKVLKTILNFSGVQNNYSDETIVFVPSNSCESFVINRLLGKRIGQISKVKYFNKSDKLLNIISFVFYFILIIKRFALCGFQTTKINKKDEFKVMLEAVRAPEEYSSFNILAWWDKEKISKDDILILSLTDKEPYRVANFRKSQNLGYHCVKVNGKRKIPFNQIKNITKMHFWFPLRNALNFINSPNVDFFLSFLMRSFSWSLFFNHYRVRTLVLANMSTDGEYLTIICNYYGCSTIGYDSSYTGVMPDHFLNKAVSANHYIVWGDAQLEKARHIDSVDNFYYSGAHPLSYFKGEGRNRLLSQFGYLQSNKKNIVFFTNKLMKDGSNTEDIYFRVLELAVKSVELYDINIFFRPTVPDALNEKYFNDKERVRIIKNKFDKAQIPILTIVDYDVMSVLSIADIIVYSQIGTPSMLALMLDIPALSYFTHIEDNPEPIMKNYLNELVFDDQEKILTKIGKIINGDEHPVLSVEDKKKLNYHLDNKGLERLQDIVSNIVN